MKATSSAERISDLRLRRRRFATQSLWAYVALLAAATAVLHCTGDLWWAGTAFCFGPRWVLLLPAPLFLALVIYDRPGRLPPLLVACLLAPFWMGFNIPFPLGARPAGGRTFRVVTFNAGGSLADRDAFCAWVGTQNPDVVVFEESDPERWIPILGHGWHWSPMRHGVIVAARHPVEDSEAILDEGRHACLRVDLRVDGVIVRIGCVHLPTPRDGIEALVHHDPRFDERMSAERREREAVSRTTADFLLRLQRVDLVAGDFNMPVESRIYQTYWGELTNVFSATGFGLGHTKFTRWHGVRIDHVLIANPNISPVRTAVGPDVGSDHHPVIAEVYLPLRPAATSAAKQPAPG